MESIDLNLDNYNLNDLLKIFKLNDQFSERDLKNAKKIVLNMHPDKSKLDKKYFLFFSRAYKQLLKLYEFRKGSQTVHNDYKDINPTDDAEVEAEKKLLLEAYMKLSPDHFNKWFNNMWVVTENAAGQTSSLKSNGYGDWLISNEGCCDKNEFNGLSKQEKERLLNKKKSDMSTVVKHRDFDEMINTTNQSLLCDDEISGFQSDVFSKLQYDDLKHAHEESIIPVTEDDKRVRYSNMDEIKRFRGRQNITPMNEAECNQYKERCIKDENNISRAYKLLKEGEDSEKRNNEWWGKIKHIQGR